MDLVRADINDLLRYQILNGHCVYFDAKIINLSHWWSCFQMSLSTKLLPKRIDRGSKSAVFNSAAPQRSQRHLLAFFENNQFGAPIDFISMTPI